MLPSTLVPWATGGGARECEGLPLNVLMTIARHVWAEGCCRAQVVMFAQVRKAVAAAVIPGNNGFAVVIVCLCTSEKQNQHVPLCICVCACLRVSVLHETDPSSSIQAVTVHNSAHSHVYKYQGYCCSSRSNPQARAIIRSYQE